MASPAPTASPDSRPSPARRVWRMFVVTPYRQVIRSEHPAVEKFFRDRCTHLAGMIAYFAVLSVIPALFIAFSALTFAGLTSNDLLLDELQYVLPEQQAQDLIVVVEVLDQRSGSLGLIGLIGVVWGTLGFFSVLESAFNIIYGVENRAFLRQKVWVLFLVSVSLVLLVASVVLASAILPLLDDAIPSERFNFGAGKALLTAAISAAGVFLFHLSVYRLLPNAEIHTRDVWRGALLATVGFQISIYILPAYLAYGDEYIVLKAFAGALILLVWFYLMANITLAGAVFNWWWVERRMRRAFAALAPAARPDGGGATDSVSAVVRADGGTGAGGSSAGGGEAGAARDG